jgi:hypothetical protein
MNYREFSEATGFEAKCGFTLAPLQVQDVEQFVQWDVSLNNYEVGGGKTVVSSVVSLMRTTGTTVVIVPPILISPWTKWLTQVSDKVLRYEGPPKWRAQQELPNYRWVVMSHGIFRKDFEQWAGKLRQLDLEVIVDEAQAVKNPKSVLYSKLYKLAHDRKIQLLTGTPTSKPLDCYTYIRLKTPEFYRSYAHFEQVHVAERDFFGAVKSYQNLEVLRDRFAVKTIKRSKEEIHGYKKQCLFPDSSYDLDPDHYKLYEKLLDEQLLVLDDGSMIDGTTATRLYHLMQQIVVNYDHFSGDPTKRSKAYDLLDLTIEDTECLEIGRSKLIVWTYYTMTTAKVLAYLKGKGYKAVAAYSGADSAKSFELFMTDPETRIGVFQPQSAGAGLNPQGVCWEALYLEMSTTPMLSRQSLGRLDRVGQMHTPSFRLGVANKTVQPLLLEKLLSNDDEVSYVERTKKSLRSLLLGEKSV